MNKSESELIHSFTHFLSLTSPLEVLLHKSCHPGFTEPRSVGEKIIYGSHTHFFDYRRTWRASKDEGWAQCRGHLRDNETWKTILTIDASIHSNKVNMKGWLWRLNDIRGTCGPKASWHLSCRWGKNSIKSSPRKLVPTGDRTRARCMTGVHATACPTAVDVFLINFDKYVTQGNR